MDLRNPRGFSSLYPNFELRSLSAEVGRIAETLANIVGHPGGISAFQNNNQIVLDHVKAVIRARKVRDQYFDGRLFSDPAWDMLLDLYRADLEQHRVSVSSLCIASNSPATTALRWIQTLSNAGLTTRINDPVDKRRHYINLSETGKNAMQAYFAGIRRRANDSR